MIDTILYNGNIITMNPSQPRVSALALRGGRIMAAGSDNDVRHLATAATTEHNLNGNTVIPGLIDAHLHFEWLSKALQAVDLFEVPSKDEALRRVQAKAAETPAGEWLTGRGWTQDVWNDGLFPTATDLDQVTPAHPAIFQAKSGHAAWVNSRALEVAGITADTPDPEGGKIARDDSGQATGILLETAIELVASQVPEPDTDTLADYMAYTQELAFASGLTGIHDYDNPSCMAALQVLRERGELGLRVVKQINRDWLEHALALKIRSGFGDEWIRFGSLKLFADGALGPRTAYMIDPYEGEPDNTGMTVVSKEAMMPLIRRASAGGLSSTVHAIGDKAVRDVLDIYERTRQDERERGESTRERRHRIEHVQLIHPDDAGRLAEMDIIASMQPIHATSDWQIATRYWGEERAYYSYNARLQIDRGARVAFGSDAPVEPFEPLKGLHAAITRQRPDGTPPGGWFPELRLTLDEALHGFTTGAAYAAGMEHEQGQLKTGYLADLVVLDSDPYSVPPEQILHINILATMSGGVWRYGGFD